MATILCFTARMETQVKLTKASGAANDSIQGYALQAPFVPFRLAQHLENISIVHQIIAAMGAAKTESLENHIQGNHADFSCLLCQR